MKSYLKTNISITLYNIVSPLLLKNWPIYTLLLTILIGSRSLDLLAINFLGNESMIGVYTVGIINFLLIFIIPFSILFMITSLEYNEYSGLKLIFNNALKPFKYISSFFVILFSLTFSLLVTRIIYSAYKPFQEISDFFIQLFMFISENSDQIIDENIDNISLFIQNSEENLLLFNENIIANLNSPFFWIVVFLSGFAVFCAFILPIIFYFNKYFDQKYSENIQKNIKQRMKNVLNNFKNQLIVILFSFVILLLSLFLVTMVDLIIVNLLVMLYVINFIAYMIVHIITIDSQKVDKNIIIQDIEEGFTKNKADNDE